MQMSNKKKLLAVSAITVALIAGSAGIASATPAGQEFLGSFLHFGGGATDLNGNEVPSKSVISETPPSDLGQLEFSGSASVGDQGNSSSAKAGDAPAGYQTFDVQNQDAGKATSSK